MTIWVILFFAVVLFALWFVRKNGGTQAALQRLRHRDWQSISRHESRLRHLVGAATAERLIENALLSNPGKSRSWCAEKALYEYQRDRR